MNERPVNLAIAFAAGAVLALAIREIVSRLASESRTQTTSRSSSQSGESSDHEGIESAIGNTPLFVIKSLSEVTGCTILAKAEFLNGAGGSPKDRVALSIIEKAELAGLLEPQSGDTIYEGTVGSTGISLATLCRARGYLAHIFMPSDQAMEKSDLLLKLGAKVDRVKPAPIVDQTHYVNQARRMAAEHSADPNRPGRGFFADQFETEANWQAHYEGTGPEILRQCHGKLDAFVAGAGTGGTISGVAMFLKSKLPNIKIVLADPTGSGLYNKVKYGVMFHQQEKEGTRRRQQVDSIVEGIGLTRSTANFEAGREAIDDAVKVTDAHALAMARWLVEKDGIFVGSSSAVNCELPDGSISPYADEANRFRHGTNCSESRTRSPARYCAVRFWIAPLVKILEGGW
jgi:cysteine synthase